MFKAIVSLCRIVCRTSHTYTNPGVDLIVLVEQKKTLTIRIVLHRCWLCFHHWCVNKKVPVNITLLEKNRCGQARLKLSVCLKNNCWWFHRSFFSLVHNTRRFKKSKPKRLNKVISREYWSGPFWAIFNPLQEKKIQVRFIRLGRQKLTNLIQKGSQDTYICRLTETNPWIYVACSWGMRWIFITLISKMQL